MLWSPSSLVTGPESFKSVSAQMTLTVSTSPALSMSASPRQRVLCLVGRVVFWRTVDVREAGG